MATLTRVSVDVHYQSITPSMFGAMEATASEKVVFESVKVATGNGRKTTNLKTPIDSLSVLLKGLRKEGIPTALLSYV